MAKETKITIKVVNITINWKECASYEEARDCYESVYIHEWSDQPYYVGKTVKSVFGGSTRSIGGRERSPRYQSGYRHWIDGCLERGAKLFIGTFPDIESNIKRLSMLRGYSSLSREQYIKEVITWAEEQLIFILQPESNRNKKTVDGNIVKRLEPNENEDSVGVTLSHVGEAPQYLRS